jgi:type IV secretory pathway VirJ component
MLHPTVRRAGRAVAVALATVAAAPLVRAQPPAGVSAGPSAPDAPRDLPLVEVPVAARAGVTPGTPAERTLAIVITGDGDWAALVKGMSATLAQSGTPVVGLRARAYLSRGRRTPEGTARDVERVARHYMARWGRDRLAIIGYSRGADFVPFVANRLSPDLRARVAVLGMYGIADAASFEFRWQDLVKDTRRATDLPTAPELARLRGTPMFCVYGTDEKDSACRGIDPTLVRAHARSGAHHFDGDPAALGALAVDAIARGR